MTRLAPSTEYVMVTVDRLHYIFHDHDDLSAFAGHTALHSYAQHQEVVTAETVLAAYPYQRAEPFDKIFETLIFSV